MVIRCFFIAAASVVTIKRHPCRHWSGSSISIVSLKPFLTSIRPVISSRQVTIEVYGGVWQSESTCLSLVAVPSPSPSLSTLKKGV